MGSFFWIAVAWVVLNVIIRIMKQNAARERDASGRARPPERDKPQRLQPPRRVVEYPEPRATGEADSRRLVLSDVLKQIERLKRAEEIRRTGEAVRGGRTLASGRGLVLPSAQEVENRETLEGEGDSPAPAAEDQDDDAIRLVEQRRREVEAREGVISDADYAAFEQKARQDTAAVAPHERKRSRYTAQQLRAAFIWLEILGPPVALREKGFPV